MTEDVGFDVFDVHHHVGRAFDALGGGLDDAGGDAAEIARVELAERLRIMDEGGISQALVIPGHGYLRPNGLADTRRVNDEIAAYRDNTPDRFPVACGIVEPRDGPYALDEIDRLSSELRLVAISFHTRFQGVSMDSQWIVRYLERMGELGLVPVIHAMDDTPEESLWKLASIARSLPDLTILALDAFSSYEATKQCFFVADVAPNIVFDTSLSYNFDFIEEFAVRFGPERVLFGTDLYSWPVGRRVSHLLPQIVACGLPRDAKASILGDNARRLFGVRVGAPDPAAG
ncbi:MAG TPA: amidohydrolase family protein [Acidimicrobiia bacterium]|nr:amidohydrolase family protein [Acidimicrobiia bacterium]